MILSPDRHILINADLERGRCNETIDIHYSDSGGTNNMNFSFVTCRSIPIPRLPEGSFIFWGGLYCPPLIPAGIRAIPGIPEESILAEGPAKLINDSGGISNGIQIPPEWFQE